MVSNTEFLKAIFKDEFIWAHVTDFCWDPSNIPKDSFGKAWAGNFYINSRLRQYANQYFTISLFNESVDDKARRRKELFKACYCIVIDDVVEKVSVDKLVHVKPSWILETSKDSFQYGYILDEPCEDRQMVEKLLLGIIDKVANEGIDPGMAGVTRYVRLPEGYNLKRSKWIDNAPWKCKLRLWNPNIITGIWDLADAFEVDLTTKLEDKHLLSKNKSLSDHPVWEFISGHREVGKGKYNITCPWYIEHTGQVDDGAMLFLGENGQVGFKCHHGHHITKCGQDVINWISSIDAKWKQRYKQYRKKLRRTEKPCIIKIHG